MNLENLASSKKFIFYAALNELKESNCPLDERISILLTMTLAFYPLIDEGELIEYISFVGINLKSQAIFEVVSQFVTSYVAVGGIMVENLLDPSLVCDESSEAYKLASGNDDLRSLINEMSDDISTVLASGEIFE